MQAQSGGLGFLGTLTLIFITLKLIGTVTWSWWWVLSPIWIPLAVWMAFAVLALLIVALLDVCGVR